MIDTKKCFNVASSEKKEYQPATLLVLYFNAHDVIRTSDYEVGDAWESNWQ